MTVAWSTYAQSITKQPMKAMLTGPITILCWSFVRDDIARAQTARQLALVLRDEVADLEQNDLRIIQIDEPSTRGLAPQTTRLATLLGMGGECFSPGGLRCRGRDPDSLAYVL